MGLPIMLRKVARTFQSSSSASLLVHSHQYAIQGFSFAIDVELAMRTKVRRPSHSFVLTFSRLTILSVILTLITTSAQEPLPFSIVSDYSSKLDPFPFIVYPYHGVTRSSERTLARNAPRIKEVALTTRQENLVGSLLPERSAHVDVFLLTISVSPWKLSCTKLSSNPKSGELRHSRKAQTWSLWLSHHHIHIATTIDQPSRNRFYSEKTREAELAARVWYEPGAFSRCWERKFKSRNQPLGRALN